MDRAVCAQVHPDSQVTALGEGVFIKVGKGAPRMEPNPTRLTPSWEEEETRAAWAVERPQENTRKGHLQAQGEASGTPTADP